MDFAQLQLPELINVHITDAQGNKVYADDERKKPVMIGLHLPESEAMRSYDNKVHNKVLKTINKRNANKITTSLEESREESIDRLVAYTASVDNFVFDGKTVTVKDIKSIYENVHLAFIKKQLNERLESYSNFLDQ